MEKKTQQCTKKKIPKEIHMFFIFFRISWPQYMIKSVRNFFLPFQDHVKNVIDSNERNLQHCNFFLLSVLFWFYLNFCVALKVWRLFALLFLSINFELTKWERVNEALHVVVVAAVFFFYYWGMCQTGKSGPKCLPMLQKRNKHCCWPFYILRMNVHILRRVKQYKTFNRIKCLWIEKNPSRHTFNGNLFKMGQISRASKNGIMNSFQSRYHRTVTALIPFSTCFSY